MRLLRTGGVGCIGSGHADMSFFSDCRFVIQCDRKGNGDMVTQINGMKLCSNDFISASRSGGTATSRHRD